VPSGYIARGYAVYLHPLYRDELMIEFMVIRESEIEIIVLPDFIVSGPDDYVVKLRRLQSLLTGKLRGPHGRDSALDIGILQKLNRHCPANVVISKNHGPIYRASTV